MIARWQKAGNVPTAWPLKQEEELAAAVQHLAASLPNVGKRNYGGEHWLASFTVLALLK